MPKRCSPRRARPPTSWMSDSKPGTTATTSGRRAISSAKLGFSPRDHLVVRERLADRAQNPGDALDVGEGTDPCAASSPRDRRSRSRDQPGRGTLAVDREQVVGQRLVEHERAEVEAALDELGAEVFRLPQRSTFERRDDRRTRSAGRATVVPPPLPARRILLHRLEVQEELGDVLQELAAEDAVGHLVEGPAGHVQHARPAARLAGTAS